MGKEMNITLEGVKLDIRKMEQSELKGVLTKTINMFDFYAAKYKDCEFMLLEPTNNDCSRYTLTQFSDISKGVSDIFGKPVAYLLDNSICQYLPALAAVGICHILAYSERSIEQKHTLLCPLFQKAVIGDITT